MKVFLNAAVAIDPGPKRSAYARLEGGVYMEGAIVPNETLLRYLVSEWFFEHLVIERIRSYGMPAGAELFETAEWSGRFMQAFISQGDMCKFCWLERKDVKLHLCGQPRATDANIRQALIDRYGGKEMAIGRKGTKKKPGMIGPLYDVSKDIWSALAVAMTWLDTRKADAA